MPPVGIMFPVLTVGAILLDPVVGTIEESVEPVTITLEFPLFDIPGVGIIAPIAELLLTICGYRWF